MGNDHTLFVVQAPRYVIDTNVVLGFLKQTDDEAWGADAFPAHWKRIEAMLTDGRMVSTTSVLAELSDWKDRIPTLVHWLRTFAAVFLDPTTEQLRWAKQIANQYPVYGTAPNFEADLMVMAMAGALGAAVFCAEKPSGHGPKRPKMPYVCEENGIDFVTVSEFFRREPVVS